MKIYRIRCDKCRKEVETRKTRQLVIGPQDQGKCMTCAPESMMNANSIAYATITIDLCNDCLKEFLSTIPGMEEIAKRF